jgi:transposase-like protein
MIMDRQSFQQLITELDVLPNEQRQILLTRLQYLINHADALRLIEERVGSQPRCPHCHDARIVRFGHVRNQQRYRCNACHRTFIALTGTPFQYLHDKDKLLKYAETMAQSLSLRRSAKLTNIVLTRSFRWRHCFLTYLDQQQPPALQGIVEADETFFRLSFKGQRNPAKRLDEAKILGYEQAVLHNKRPLVPVLVAMQRGQRLSCDRLLPRRNLKQITLALRAMLSSDVILSSDGNVSYRMAARTLGIEHGSFVASISGHGGLSSWHVQNVNAYDRRLKEWMARFHGVATKYLSHYLGWRRLLDRCKDMVSGEQILFHALRKEFINT